MTSSWRASSFCLRSPQFLTDDTDDGGGPAQDECTRLQTDCVRKRMNQVVQLAGGFASQGNQAQLHRLAVEGGKDLMAKRRRIELSQMESDPTDSACTCRAQRGPAFDPLLTLGEAGSGL